jgi:hypothetical protein
MIFYGNRDLQMLGPYHPDEIQARQQAKMILGLGAGRDVYQVQAASIDAVRDRLIAVVRTKSKGK